MYLLVYSMYYVKLINAAVNNAKACSRLHCLQHVSDPSYEVVDVLRQTDK